jgi:hypothetical protein
MKEGDMIKRHHFLRHGFKIVPALLLLINAPCLYADHDTSWRTDLNFHYKINDKFRSVSYLFLQADKNVSNFDYFEWGTALQYQTDIPWLSFLLYYQQGFSKIEPDNWLLEQKPSISMNTSAVFSHFKISNQIRYEYRFTPDWSDYRIKYYLEISCPNLSLQPLIGWEMFYENRDKAVMLNRIKFGVIKNVNENVSFGAYYRIDYSNSNHEWEFTRQLIGLQLTLKY